jgi:hypothetical protein
MTTDNVIAALRSRPALQQFLDAAQGRAQAARRQKPAGDVVDQGLAIFLDPGRATGTVELAMGYRGAALPR